MQGDLKVGVAVLDHRERRADRNLHAEFLPNLTPETRRQGFAGLLFAAGKFPQPAEHAVQRALGDQDFVATPNHGGGDIVVGQLFLGRLDRQAGFDAL